jgi:NADPH:quinone reductase-like Zn-dependent oxidoreductase
MKSLSLVVDPGGSRLVPAEVPTPQPGPSELLIRVHAAGVTVTELAWYPTLHTKSGESRQHPIPAHEFSGVVAAAGSDVTGVAVGDEVFGMNDWYQDGALAEYCLTLPSSIAPKPQHSDHAAAASVPIGALTAWQGLFDRANLQAGEHVFVQGAAGGVGLFVVQLAKASGAHVTATAAARNFDFVKTLGADDLIDYHADYFEKNLGRFDIVFDVLGGDVLRKSWPMLKPGGRMVTTAETQADERVKEAFFIVAPDRLQLAKIAAMLEAGRLRTEVDSVVPFEQAPEVYAGTFHGKRGRGKIVVDVARLTDSR